MSDDEGKHASGNEGKDDDGGLDMNDFSDADVKIILLGDSAVGKSKLVERFLMNDYQPRQLSTYALTLFRHVAAVGGEKVEVDFWDTAGQERFNSMHPAYYHMAHACVLCFDVTRKQTWRITMQRRQGTWLAPTHTRARSPAVD